MTTKGISREGESPGWLARVYREGRTVSRFFSDARNGGEDEALTAAQKWHAAAESVLPPSEPSDKPFSSSQSGIRGVSDTEQVDPSGNKRFYIQADYVDAQGRHHNKKFRWNNLDEREQAIKDATAWLQQKREKDPR